MKRICIIVNGKIRTIFKYISKIQDLTLKLFEFNMVVLEILLYSTKSKIS